MIVKIFGGLGNQMFQYAFAKSLSELYHTQVWLDCSEFGRGTFITDRKYMLDIFNITLPVIDKQTFEVYRIYSRYNIINRIRRFIVKIFPAVLKEWIVERSFLYKAKYQKKAVYYEGYWQSPKYFDEIRNSLIKDFTLKSDVDIDRNLMNKIVNQESVSIHVRRGDYVHNSKVTKHHGLLDQDYYKKAIEYIQKKRPNALYFVFSDEIEWVKKNMFKDIGAHFIESSTAACELYLMSLCKNNIIANSTFSWWSAYLNMNNEKIVIAPHKWLNDETSTKDIIPESWIQI